MAPAENGVDRAGSGTYVLFLFLGLPNGKKGRREGRFLLRIALIHVVDLTVNS